jgi:hypothetical protein
MSRPKRGQSYGRPNVDMSWLASMKAGGSPTENADYGKAPGQVDPSVAMMPEEYAKLRYKPVVGFNRLLNPELAATTDKLNTEFASKPIFAEQEFNIQQQQQAATRMAELARAKQAMLANGISSEHADKIINDFTSQPVATGALTGASALAKYQAGVPALEATQNVASSKAVTSEASLRQAQADATLNARIPNLQAKERQLSLEDAIRYGGDMRRWDYQQAGDDNFLRPAITDMKYDKVVSEIQDAPATRILNQAKVASELEMLPAETASRKSVLDFNQAQMDLERPMLPEIAAAKRQQALTPQSYPNTPKLSLNGVPITNPGYVPNDPWKSMLSGELVTDAPTADMPKTHVDKQGVTWIFDEVIKEWIPKKPATAQLSTE